MQHVQKLISILYFYILSIVGMVLIIIGLFNAFHFIVGITAYGKYPLRYNAESQCSYIYKPMSVDMQKDSRSDKEIKDECLQGLEKERMNAKIDDLEKSVAFTIIGLLIFGSDFYFARKEKKS